jgi:3-oxoacyl-[acyl-carrier protein] reductase
MLHAAELTGRAALVTGAASGIGRATALALAREGVGVVCFDLADPGPVVQDVVSAGGQAVGSRGSVTVEADVAQAVALCEETFGPLSLAVNSAGSADFESLEDGSVETWQRQLAINLVGPMVVLKHTLALMRPRGSGCAILFGSVAGKTGGIRSGPAYGASKGGVHALVKWAAHAYAAHGVRVNAIAPGPVMTPMTEGRGYRADTVPLGRFGEPGEVAETVVYLASDAGAWITGQTLNVNGGVLME